VARCSRADWGVATKRGDVAIKIKINIRIFRKMMYDIIAV
jgi:hypothetical protein